MIMDNRVSRNNIGIERAPLRGHLAYHKPYFFFSRVIGLQSIAED